VRFRANLPEPQIRQLLAMLKFRLAVKLKEICNIAFINRRGARKDVENLLIEFEQKDGLPDVTLALKSCIHISQMKLIVFHEFPSSRERNKNSWQQLCSNIFEADASHVACCGEYRNNRFHVSTIDAGYRNSALQRGSKDGDEHFVRSAGSCRLLSRESLEVIYFWAFATYSAIEGTLDFGYSSNLSRCAHLRPGRLFPTDVLTPQYDITTMEHKIVLHFTDDRGPGKLQTSDPLADLFFISAEGELVLVDITSGDASVVGKKVQRLEGWANQFNKDGRSVVARGVMLAPEAPRYHTTLLRLRL